LIVHRALFRVLGALCRVYGALFRVCGALFHRKSLATGENICAPLIDRTFSIIYRALFRAHRALFRVYRALFRVYGALFGVCGAFFHRKSLETRVDVCEVFEYDALSHDVCEFVRCDSFICDMTHLYVT